MLLSGQTQTIKSPDTVDMLVCFNACNVQLSNPLFVHVYVVLFVGTNKNLLEFTRATIFPRLPGTDAPTDLHLSSILGLLLRCFVWCGHGDSVSWLLRADDVCFLFGVKVSRLWKFAALYSNRFEPIDIYDHILTNLLVLFLVITLKGLGT